MGNAKEDAEMYRVFCAYPRSCGAETHVDSEHIARVLVEFHEDANDGNHTADYEEVGERER